MRRTLSAVILVALIGLSACSSGDSEAARNEAEPSPADGASKPGPGSDQLENGETAARPSGPSSEAAARATPGGAGPSPASPVQTQTLADFPAGDPVARRTGPKDANWSLYVRPRDGKVCTERRIQFPFPPGGEGGGTSCDHKMPLDIGGGYGGGVRDVYGPAPLEVARVVVEFKDAAPMQAEIVVRLADLGRSYYLAFPSPENEVRRVVAFAADGSVMADAETLPGSEGAVQDARDQEADED